MAGRPQSKTAQKRSKARDSAARMARALDAYRAELTRALAPGEKRRGVRYFAKVNGVSYCTLARLARGKRSLVEFNASKQKLSPEQELKLVELAELSADRGFPLTHALIRDCATHLLSEMAPDLLPLGKNWVDRFIERHRARLQTHWSKGLDKVRANAANPETLTHWFENIVRKHVVEPKVPPHCLFGMDEAAFTPGANESQIVIGRRGEKMTYMQGTENRETVTVIVTICADGSWLPPLVIFKAKNFQRAWRKNNVANCSFAHSPNGWTDSEIALGWLRAFDEQTREKANGEDRVLFLDCHASHLAPAFIRYGLEHGIKITALPPHTTHVSQGLDVVCFSVLKRVWSEKVATFESKNGPVKKSDFAGIFGEAIKEALTPHIVKTAFSATGIHPFNPDVVLAKARPSRGNSSRGSFPQPQTSPVRAVVAAFSALPPAAFDVDPDTHLPAQMEAQRDSSSPAIPIDPALLSTPSRVTVPCTPKRRPLLDVDPSLFTPSKRMRTLSAALSNTRASYLVGPARATSAQVRSAMHAPVIEAVPELPEPDWSLSAQKDLREMTRPELERYAAELAGGLNLARQHLFCRNSMLENANAQLILQHLHLNKLTDALHGKETRDQTATRSHFPNGHGRVLTDTQFVAALEAEEARRMAEQVEKEKRKANKESRAQRKAENEALWETWMAKYENDVVDWQNTCTELRAAGTRVKDLPRKPARPKRADLPSLDPEERENIPVEDDDDDNL